MPKFTVSEELAIIRMYENGKTKKEISEKISKKVNSGNIQSIKKRYGIEDRNWDNRKPKILAVSGEVIRLSKLGYNANLICDMVGIELGCKYLFKRYLGKDFSTKYSFNSYDPAKIQEAITDYENGFSINDINKKYGIDTHIMQTQLLRRGTLRNFKETIRMKKEKGLYPPVKASSPHRYSGSIEMFSKKKKNEIRLKNLLCCSLCKMSELDHQINFSKTLLVHHICPYETCKLNNIIDNANDNRNLITVCQDCHKKVHDRMRKNKKLFSEVIKIYKEDIRGLTSWFLKNF